ncbi:MAG: PAS domain S-box protein [Chroococcidiopsidaceae cyanobacterium CP_BM_ER_R8_30]|nr:PAS domain S-box protein [Chroococcidiopsidaceae cyanobacterium CP_BM_ER_R8_30]
MVGVNQLTMQLNKQLIDFPTLDRIIDRSPLTIHPDTLVVDAISLLSQAQACCVLVVEDLQLVGVLTERDVVRLIASKMNLSQLNVASVVRQQVVTLTQSNSQDAYTAFSLMSQHQICHLPIVDERGQLVGLITRSSLMQVFEPTAIGNVIEAIQKQLEARTAQWQQEIAQRQEIEQDLCQAQTQLERAEIACTQEVMQTNKELQATLEELRISEEEVRSANEELMIARQRAELECQRYQDLFEFAPDGYLVTDTAGTIQQANQAAAALLSTAQKWLVGKPLAIFIAKQYRKTFRKQLTNLQPIQDGELSLQPQGGMPFPARIKLAAAYSLQGEHIGWRCLIRDITLQKQAEAALLRKSEGKFEAVFNSAIDAIAIVDDDGRYINANPSACELYGVSKADLLASTIADFAEPGFDFTEIRQGFRERKRLAQGELRLQRRDGVVREVEYTATGNFLPDLHLLIFRDISDRKQAEETLRQSEEKFRQLAENMRSAVWITSPDASQNIYISPAYKRIWGRSCQSLREKPLS